jgi:hypothetical protein
MKSIGNPFENLRRRTVEVALDLAQVGVRDVRSLRQLPQGEVRELALHADECPETAALFHVVETT